MNGYWFVLCILFCAVSAQPAALNFTVGDQLAYNLNALLDTKGFDVTTNSRTGGSFGNMSSTVVIQCTDEDEYSYMFVMNMWNTAVGVGQADDLSSGEPQLLGDWLGDDMYFQQNKTGEIVEIWYTDGDSEYFIEVKIGAINAFQTHILPVSASQVFEESDPVGTHLSTFVGASGESQTLQVTKTFTQNDVSAFPDANLRPQNILLSAQTVTTIHSEGYILSSSVSQSVNLVNIAQDISKSAQEGDSTTTALNIQFSSVGSLDIEFTDDSSVHKQLKTRLNKKELTSNTDYKRGSLFEVAAQLMQSKRFHGKRHFNRFHGDIDHFVSEFIVATDSRKITKMIPRLAHAISRNPDNLEAFQSRMEGLLQDAKIRNKYFSVLARAARRGGEKLVLQYLNSQNEKIQVEMIRHLQFMKRPSETMVNALVKLVKKSNSLAVKQASLVAVGSLARRSHKYSDKIVEFLGDFLEKEDVKPELMTYVIHAIGNAGVKTVPAKYTILLRKFLENSSKTVRKAATMTLEKLQAKVAWEGSNFPFNKTFNYDAKLGGATVNADFDVELFAGSNFDCKQTDFNYEALASATATIDMWSYSKQAFIAEVIYGQANNQVVGDEVLVQLFDDVIYHQTLPTIDCLQHTYEIYQTSPGFSVSYFIWQMVIPIVFTASADLNFELSWGYDVCVNQLDAMVELVPQADIVISGDAVVDLLIIQAGIELDGSFNTQLNPQLYVHGTECQVGIDVERVSQPMNIDLTAYYAWKDCKYWIFDCHWGQHNQDTLFSWDYPSVDQVIYNQSWQIQV